MKPLKHQEHGRTGDLQRADIKNVWPWKPLGEVCKTGSGGTPLSSRKEYYEGGTIPWLVSGEVAQGNVHEAKNFITMAGLENSAAKLFPKDTVLVAMYGATAGQVGILRFEAATNQAVCGILPNDKFVPEFIFYFLLAKKDELVAQATGNAQPNISQVKIKNTEIPLPPLAEQQRIVAILDEAFEGIATARKHAEQNLQNAKALFESHLQTIFTQSGPTGQEHVTSQTLLTDRNPAVADNAKMARLHAGYVTRTGGRVATTRLIPGPLSLAVGMPSTGARKGWRWTALTDLARLESGHTPSRNHPEYWGGAIPWLGIQDARKHHGYRIDETSQTINELGTANSSARLLPANTVCLSRTASVGYVVVMGRPMATSQDFVNWVCSASLIPDFLKYIFLAERRDGLLRYASGSVHQTIYFPEAKAFYICHPDINEQLQIINQCDALRDETNRLCDIYTQKIAALDALKKSLLHQAFSGEL